MSTQYASASSAAFPKQALPESRKGKEWKKSCMDWASNIMVTGDSIIHSANAARRVNYDLFDGILNIDDIVKVMGDHSGFTAKGKVVTDNYGGDERASALMRAHYANMTHYPIMNSKLNVLIGEEAAKEHSFRVTVTNPLAISKHEQQLMDNISQYVFGLKDKMAEIAKNPDPQAQAQQAEKITAELKDKIKNSWQDQRELGMNHLLNHFWQEKNFKKVFSDGFINPLVCGQEMYLVDIVGGEPEIIALAPENVRVFRNGTSTKVEDAEAVIFCEYLSPSAIVDRYAETLTVEDIKKLDDISYANYSPTTGLLNGEGMNIHGMDILIGSAATLEGLTDDVRYGIPVRPDGTVRVLKMLWKSKRRIKKITSYDPITGEEIETIMPESYKPVEELGEKEKALYVSEAWEGTKIGNDIYVDIQPRKVQFRSSDNPSKCHLGVVGQIYSTHPNGRPYSLVDIMKPYAYLYDIIYYRLTRLIARNRGILLEIDTSRIPANWELDKWMHFINEHGLIVTDSFNEADTGPASGKVAGSFNSGGMKVLDAQIGNSIQQYINLIEFIKYEIHDIVGVSRQREGQVGQRELVGTVNAAVRQSNAITQWIFTTHEDVMKRTVNAYLDVLRKWAEGKTSKLKYLTNDASVATITIEGNNLTEADYGLVAIDETGFSVNEQHVEQLALAAMQTQRVTMSALFDMYNTASIADKIDILRKSEAELLQRAERMQQMEAEAANADAQMRAEMEQKRLDQEADLALAKAEVDLFAAQMKLIPSEIHHHSDPEDDPKVKLNAKEIGERIREFDETLKLKREELAIKERQVGAFEQQTKKYSKK